MRRSPKPRIAKSRLTWKWERIQWVPYYRITWTEAGKRREKAIKLDWQGDAQLLDDLYWECQAGKHEKQKTPSRYTWRELVVAWRSDPRVQKKLSDGTKKSYRREMELLLKSNADKDVRKTTTRGLMTIHASMSESTRKADKYLSVVSILWTYGKTKLLWPLGDNPATGIDRYGKQREFEPWPEWLVAKLPESPIAVQKAAQLILGTGQRPNAAIRMEYSRFKGEWMEVLDEKGGELIEVYCPAPLRDFIASQPRTGRFVLAKNLTQPVGYNAVEKQFRAWRKSLGIKAKPYVLHGLRKLAIVRLAEAGCTDAEIQAVTNQSLETVAYYRKMANRKKLSRAAMERKQ